MPELHQILGALFADIAQSVFTSDLYSRDISRYYEQDGLLRHFPVPRTEISELELNLKFAIADIELNPVQGIEREASAVSLFLDFSYTLSEIFYDELHDALVALDVEDKDSVAEAIKQATSGVEAIYLRQDLLRFFQHHHGDLIENGIFDVKKAREEILEILQRKIKYMFSKLPKDVRNKLFDDVIKSTKLDAKLKSLSKPLSVAWNQAGDFKMDIAITAEKLGELDSEQLSSVNIRTRVRNYIWSQVEHPGSRPWWTLNPE